MITLEDRIRHAGRLAAHVDRGLVSRDHHAMAERYVGAALAALKPFATFRRPRSDYVAAGLAYNLLYWAWVKAEREFRQRLRETG